MMKPLATLSTILVLATVCSLALLADAADPPAATTVVATVNGQPIGTDQVFWEFYLHQLPDQDSTSDRQALIQQLIDRELIRQFLEQRHIEPDSSQLDEQVAMVEKIIAERGEQIDDVLSRLNLTPESLRELLALPLAWNQYVQQVVTDSQIHDEWQANRPRWDGTRVRAAQIFRKVDAQAPEEEWTQAEEFLTDLRNQIMDKKLTFAEAAADYSHSPSGKNGGDLGEFEIHGRIDPAISTVAFNTANGAISTPFRSRNGVHLVQTQERIPGQLSLEDARPQIIRHLGQKLWDRQVRQLRKQSQIDINP